ncbi:hypothetical protein [Skermania piniformis]|uniref:Uncharacterized protein n=1 Tax=Skermania pinensis TaxID=39122 RepID=A0ABX8SC70_9ACTN|nr:hypothetical protein [Skermania piniformis]QXQ14584.1 hypothetical protein KV203_04040 [Skermania piniformis]
MNDEGELEARVEALEAEAVNMKKKLRIAEVRAEFRDIRIEFREGRAEVRELRIEVNGLRGEVGDLRGDVRELRSDVRADYERNLRLHNATRADIADIRAEQARFGEGLQALGVEVRTKFDTLAAGQQQIVGLLDRLIDDRDD